MTTHTNDDGKLVVATWNIENWTPPTDEAVAEGKEPTLEYRIMLMRPMLRRLGADILALQEVHAQKGDLSALRDLLKGTQYADYDMAFTGKSRKDKTPLPFRNLVVLSRFGFTKVTQYHNDLLAPPNYRMITAEPAQKEAKGLKWERPILHTQTKLPNGKILHLINIHLKSKLPTAIPGQMINRWTWKSNQACAEGTVVSSLQRVGQAFEVRCLIDSIFAEDPHAWIMVVGDYNCDADEVPATVIRGPVTETGNPALVPFELIPCENSVSDDRRFTIRHMGHGNMFDHVMASPMLHACHTQTFIHNETLQDESAAFANDMKFPRPDHAGVRVEFNLHHACEGDCVVKVEPPKVKTAKKPTRRKTTATKKAAPKVKKATVKKTAATKTRKRTGSTKTKAS